MNTSGTPIHAPGRPFHFMVAFWGERYRDYFVDLFLPSLLAPNNLPLLQAEEGHRFFIAAPREDWKAINELPIMERLRRHAEPRWVEIDSPSESEMAGDAHARYAATLQHMKVCLRKLLEAGYHPSAYGSFHCPDTIVSDGMVALLLKSVRAGRQLVLCPALRQAEEAVLSDLETLGLLSPGKRPSLTAQELTIAPRLGADLAIRHLHPEMSVFEEGSTGQPPLPPFRYWRMPEGRGLLLRTFFTSPALMDYSIVPAEHTRCLDHDAFENVYIISNFRNCRAIQIVADSDEFLVLSLTPGKTDHSAPTVPQQRQSVLRRGYGRLCDIRSSYEFYVRRNFDVIKHDLFRTPVRWHVHDLDEVWMKEERRVERLFDRAVGDYFRQSALPESGQWDRPNVNWRTLLLDVPLFDLPSLLRGLIYRFLLQARALGREFIGANR